MRIKAFFSESGSGLVKSGSDPGIAESGSDPGIADSESDPGIFSKRRPSTKKASSSQETSLKHENSFSSLFFDNNLACQDPIHSLDPLTLMTPDPKQCNIPKNRSLFASLMKMCAYLSLLHLGKDFQLEILLSGILPHQCLYEQTDGTELGDADNSRKKF
jgi:hypothetical protein